MAGFNGAGQYVRSYSWATDASNSVPITASRMDTEDNGFATGLSNCVTRDGQSPALGNIPMGGFKITGLGNGAASSDAATVGQVANLTLGNVTAGNRLSTSLSVFTQLAGSTWPYQDLVGDQENYGTTGTPLVPSVAGGAYCTPKALYGYFGTGRTGGIQLALDVMQVRGAADAATENRNYVARQMFASATASDGGTGLTMVTGKGQLFGFGALSVIYSGATNWLNVTGGEVNVQCSAGSSVAYKSGLQISAMPSDAVQGSVYDVALSLSNQSGAVGFNYGMLFSAANGAQSVKSNGTLIGVADSPTFNYGINLNGAIFTTNAFASANFAVNGSGDVTGRNFFSSTSGAVLRIGAPSGASSVAVQFLSSGATAGIYDASLTGFGGSGVQGNGGLSADCSVLQPAADNYAALGAASHAWASLRLGTGGITLGETAAGSIATPPATTQTLFIDSADHKLKRKDSAGTVTIIA